MIDRRQAAEVVNGRYWTLENGNVGGSWKSDDRSWACRPTASRHVRRVERRCRWSSRSAVTTGDERWPDYGRWPTTRRQADATPVSTAEGSDSSLKGEARPLAAGGTCSAMPGQGLRPALRRHRRGRQRRRDLLQREGIRHLPLHRHEGTAGARRSSPARRGDKGALPPIARNGKNNGFWVHSRSLWWQNENTDLLKDHVDRRSFNDLLDERRAHRQVARRRRCAA